MQTPCPNTTPFKLPLFPLREYGFHSQCSAHSTAPRGSQLRCVWNTARPLGAGRATRCAFRCAWLQHPRSNVRQRSHDTVPFPLKRQVLSSGAGGCSGGEALPFAASALAGALALAPCPLAGCRMLCMEGEATEARLLGRGRAAGFVLRSHAPEGTAAPGRIGLVCRLVPSLGCG